MRYFVVCSDTPHREYHHPIHPLLLSVEVSRENLMPFHCAMLRSRSDIVPTCSYWISVMPVLSFSRSLYFRVSKYSFCGVVPLISLGDP